VKPIIFTITLLLTAGLYICSFGDKDKDSADADYCFYFDGDDVKDKNKNEYDYVNFLLLKQNNRLEPLVLDTAREYLECSGRSVSSLSHVVFDDESDAALFSLMLGNYSGYSRILLCADCIKTKASKIKSEKQIKLPTLITKRIEENRKREDLSRLQNRIFSAYMLNSFNCYSHDWPAVPPLLDTSYRIDFRVRITGKCGYLATKILPPAK
jgi:hypothetical protein